MNASLSDCVRWRSRTFAKQRCVCKSSKDCGLFRRFFVPMSYPSVEPSGDDRFSKLSLRRFIFLFCGFVRVSIFMPHCESLSSLSSCLIVKFNSFICCCEIWYCCICGEICCGWYFVSFGRFSMFITLLSITVCCSGTISKNGNTGMLNAFNFQTLTRIQVYIPSQTMFSWAMPKQPKSFDYGTLANPEKLSTNFDFFPHVRRCKCLTVNLCQTLAQHCTHM